MQRFRAPAHGALVAGFACLAVAQREPLPATGAAACSGCQCGDTDLSPYRTHDGGVFRTPADKDGYEYMFSMCDDISPTALPVGCRSGHHSEQALTESLSGHAAVVRFRHEDPSDCVVLGFFGPCELDSECGMSYEPVASSEAHGAGLSVFWHYQQQNGCQMVFHLFLSRGHETEPAQAPLNDGSNPCSWTMAWQSLDAYHSASGSTETELEAEQELPTGVDATIALLFCYVCWIIVTGMMVVYACGIPHPQRSNHATGAEEGRPASQHYPAVERALRFHQLSRWHRRLVTFQWATCGNVLFIVAGLVYVIAAVVNFQLTYFDVAWVGDYYFYDKINLCGALIFTIEPLIDVAGVISSTWLTTIDQAHWETFGRKQSFRADSASSSDSTATMSVGQSSQHTASNPLSASNADDGSGDAATVSGTLERRGSSDGHCSLDNDPWSLLRAPSSSQPWWQRWQWQGYVVWGKIPTTSELVLQDLNLYAALFFFLSSLGYLWAAALPWMYNDFCMDTEGTYCAIVANPEYLTQWQGPNATYTMHLQVPCGTDNSGSLVNRSGYLIGGTVSKYVEMGDVGAWGFVFDALVGLAAWWGSFKQRQSLSSAPLSLCPLWSDWRRRQRERQGDGPAMRLSGSVDYQTASAAAQTDWLGVGCCSFFFTSCLDVIYGFSWENFGGPWLYLASMVCWTLCGFCYITDSLGGTSIADITLAPRIKIRPAEPRQDNHEADAEDVQTAEEVEWVDMYEEAGLFGSNTCGIGVGGLICSFAIFWVFSSASMPHEIVTGENGEGGAD